MVKTLKEWREGKDDLYKYLGFTYNQTIIVEVDEDLHNYMLECIFPNYWNSVVFQVGEPSSHVEKGGTYTTFVKYKGRYFCIGDQLDMNYNRRLSHYVVRQHINTIKEKVNLGENPYQEPQELEELLKIN